MRDEKWTMETVCLPSYSGDIEIWNHHGRLNFHYPFDMSWFRTGASKRGPVFIFFFSCMGVI